MQPIDLQRKITASGFPITADNIFGPKSQSSFIEMMRAPVDTPLDPAEVRKAATRTKVQEPLIWAFRDVESTAKPFINGIPSLLPEPHRFSRNTKHRFDASHPHLSSKKWNRSLYPGRMEARWQMLAKMIALDVDAGLMSASYGAFQILGENYKMCGEASPFDFAWTEASEGEGGQFRHFVAFIEARGILPAMRNLDWHTMARLYNGTAYRENNYHNKLRDAFLKRGGKL